MEKYSRFADGPTGIHPFRTQLSSPPLVYFIPMVLFAGLLWIPFLVLFLLLSFIQLIWDLMASPCPWLYRGPTLFLCSAQLALFGLTPWKLNLESLPKDKVIVLGNMISPLDVLVWQMAYPHYPIRVAIPYWKQAEWRCSTRIKWMAMLHYQLMTVPIQPPSQQDGPILMPNEGMTLVLMEGTNSNGRGILSCHSLNCSQTNVQIGAISYRSAPPLSKPFLTSSSHAWRYLGALVSLLVCLFRIHFQYIQQWFPYQTPTATQLATNPATSALHKSSLPSVQCALCTESFIHSQHSVAHHVVSGKSIQSALVQIAQQTTHQVCDSRLVYALSSCSYDSKYSYYQLSS